MYSKKKILEICPFSAGICGVWTRVLSESIEFKKLGNKVRDIQVFSSNIVKGTHEYVEAHEKAHGINIKRFDAKRYLISNNVHHFKFEKELFSFRPDIIITHLLHPHSFRALKICRRLKIPCYLVTHAPFNVPRKFPLNLITSIYNSLRVKTSLNKFTKIIAITKWEIPYLKKLGVKKEKIIYIPNGIPEEFLKQGKVETKRKVLFLGRIAPIKSLETLLKVAKLLPTIDFNLVGPAEQNYLLKLKEIIKDKSIKNVNFLPPIYDLNEKIRLIDKNMIFVLPSKREAMPQVLIEAMARGKIIIASKTDGAKEIIKDRETGFLFEINDAKELAKLIKENIQGNVKIQKNAEKEARKYSWKHLIKGYPFLRR